MNLILPNLYAGSEQDTELALSEYGCKVVIDLRDEARLDYIPKYDFVIPDDRPLCNQYCAEYYLIPLQDGYFTTVEALDVAVSLINLQILQKKSVFVHCAAGVSRTCVAICAYLVAHEYMSPDEALKFAKSKCPSFSPHPNLWKSLQHFAEIYGYYLITSDTSMFKESGLI